MHEPYGLALLVCLTLSLHNVNVESNSCRGQEVFALTGSEKFVRSIRS